MAPVRFPATPFRYVARADHGYRSQTKGVVIHTMEGSYAGSLAWFLNPAAGGVGAHVLLGNAKDEVVQIVSMSNKCWHAAAAGNSAYVGIELEARASWTRGGWLHKDSRRMLRRAANRAAYVCWYYKLGEPRYRKNILGHKDVPGNNHTDPGKNFPWIFFVDVLARRAYRRLVKTNGREWE